MPSVITAPIAGWLEILWEAVCVRAARPIPGILIDAPGIQKIATTTFENFLESGGKPEATLQAMLSVLTQPVQALALQHVAEQRKAEGQRDAVNLGEKLRYGGKACEATQGQRQGGQKQYGETAVGNEQHQGHRE